MLFFPSSDIVFAKDLSVRFLIKGLDLKIDTFLWSQYPEKRAKAAEKLILRLKKFEKNPSFY